MALNKLPAEYRETHISRFKECFGNLSIEEQISLADFILKINEITGINSQKIKEIQND